MVWQTTPPTFPTFFKFSIDFQGLQSPRLYSQLSRYSLHCPSTSDAVGRLISLPLQVYLVFFLYFPSVYQARITSSSTSSPLHTLPLQLIVAEWRSLKGISTFVLSAVLAIFQLPGAFADPLLRLAGFLSFTFGLFSILYGSLLIHQLGNFGVAINEDALESGGSGFHVGTYANRWSQVLATTEGNGNSYWNVPVLLALPAIWTAWSVLAFVSTFILLLYRSTTLTHTITVTMELISGLVVTLVLVLGTMYLVLAIRTLLKLRA